MESIKKFLLDQQIQSPALILSQIEINKLNEQSKLKDWVIESFKKEFVDQRCFSMNLTFVSDINRDKALIQFKNFIKYLNRRIYGKANKRFPEEKYIKLLAIIEGGGNSGKEFHYHCLIVKPYDRIISDDEFSTLIKDCWFKQPKAMKNKEVAAIIEKIYDLGGWAGYISKSYSKDTSNDKTYFDSIDLQSSYF
jgi:hypothetical protein